MTTSTAANCPPSQHVASSTVRTMSKLCHVIVVYVLIVTLFVLLFVVHYSHRQQIERIRQDVEQLQALVCRQSSAIYNCDEILLRQHNVNSSRPDGDVGSAALLRSERKRRNDDASTSSSPSVNVEDDDQAAAGSGEITDRGDVMMNVISKIPVPVLKEVCTAALETCSLQARPGPPGMPGPQGMPGQPGPPGEVGLPGLPGLPGPQGIQGEKGDSGMNGTAGEPGPPGAPGQNGSKGEQGLTGEPGPMGNCSESPFNDAMLSGLKGEKGERGVDGAKGDKGDEGLHGLPGVEGPPGYNGTDGQRGRRGQKGAPGPIGLRGLKGDKGDVGDKGERGATGPAASGGSLTRSASDNATGPFYGMRGLPGPPGLPGMKGSKGDPGYSCGCDMTTEEPTTETPTTVEPTIEPRLTECRIQKIGTPVYQNSTTVNFGMWLRDSSPSSPMRYRYWITRHFTGRQLFGYEGLEQLKKNQPFVVYELDKLYFGTGNVVYNGAFYYHWAGNNRVLKYDLMINSTVANVTIDNAAYQNKGLYSTDYNYFDLAVDDNGLWVVYVVGSDPDALRVAKLDLVDLTIQKKWRVEVRNHTYGNGFVVCGILYLVKDIHANVTAIDFAYDLYENRPITDINLPFRNPYGMNNMIAYNHIERKIYSWDHQNLLIYPLLT